MSLKKENIEKYSEQFPHYKTYAECTQSALVSAYISFVLSGATVYVAQELLRSKLPYARTTFPLPSLLFGSYVAYRVIKRKTFACQQMWMAMEDKHSALSVIQKGKIDFLQKADKENNDTELH